MRYLGTTKAKLQDMIHQVYPDGTGTIDFSEFLSLMTKQMKDNEDKLFRDIKDLNIDVNGPVTDGEIKNALISEENSIDEEESSEYISTDKEVSIEENLTHEEASVEENLTHEEASVEENLSDEEASVEENLSDEEASVEGNLTDEEVAEMIREANVDDSFNL